MLHKRTAGIVCGVNGVLSLLIASGLATLGEVRYHNWVDQVTRARHHGGICPPDYNGPFLNDCQKRRVL